MKKYLLASAFLIAVINSFGFSIIKEPVIFAKDVFTTSATNGNRLSLLQLSTISIKDYELNTGKHLNFFQRLAFKSSQKKLRKNINADGSIKENALSKKSFGDAFSEFSIGGFLLGLFLFLPGVLIAYLLGGDEDVKRSRTKWAWSGAAIFAIIALALLNRISQ